MDTLKTSSLRILFLLSILVFTNCSNRVISEDSNSELTKEFTNAPKINGVSMVSVRGKIDSTAFIPVANINATWVANIPFGFIRENSGTVIFNRKRQWYGEKSKGVIQSILLAKEQGLKTFLKPHIWIHDKWIGDLDFEDSTHWQEFETSYTNFILHYAKIADSMNVQAFCIGVELRKIATQRPQFWSNLISSVRSVYKGKLTYAANWDNYENIPFWDQLDYIGIDAYFPVSEKQSPSKQECFEGWKSNYEKIKSLSYTHNKKVIFTEFGYRNVDHTGQSPWEDGHLTTINNTGQNNAYLALFDRFWNENWFEGGFLWKWYPNHTQSGGIDNNRFTPQNKPVEEIISNHYLDFK